MNKTGKWSRLWGVLVGVRLDVGRRWIWSRMLGESVGVDNDAGSGT